MSAPVLHPTARMRPVLIARMKRQSLPHCFAALGLAALAVYLRVDSVQVTYSAAVACVLGCGAFLPDVQAIGSGDRVWDATLPADPARYAETRLVCGVAGAAFLLAVMVVLYTALFGNPAHPGWYPLALLAWGLTAHLLVSAALLGADGRMWFIVVPGLCALIYAFVPAVWDIPIPEELARTGMTVVLAKTAFPLGLAGAIAYVAARFPAPASLAGGHRRSPWAPVHEDPPAPHPSWPAPPRSQPAPTLIRRSGPARPSAALTVFRRHFALLRRFMIVPALTLPVVILFVLTEPILHLNQAGERPTVRAFVRSTQLGGGCAWIALSWSMLVWLAERDPRRRWNDTLPVGTAKRRILHAAAGAAWLLLFLPVLVAAPLGRAVAAEMLASPAEVPAWLWLGLPLRTLTLYLAASAVFCCARVAHQVLPLVGPYLSLLAGSYILNSQALFDIPSPDPAGWSHAVSVLWLVLYATAAVGAIALDEWIRHLDRLPTVREVRAILHGWAGTRPGPPLRGHAAR